jgi:hypothetical protein
MLLKERSHVLHQHHQVERIGGRLLEVVLHVPGLRGLVLGVNEQDSRADRVRRIYASQEDILEKGAPEARSLVFAIDGEPREEDRRHWPGPWLPLERASRSVLWGDLGGRESVVADDRLTVVQRRDEHAGGVRRLRTERMPLQPVAERRLAAVEVLKPMLLPERLGPPVRHRLGCREDARLGEELLKAGLFLR